MRKNRRASKKRLAILEAGHGFSRETGDKAIKLDLILPEADIGGLHFNKTEVHAVFEKQEDGWYYSRDILFISVRNTEDDNSRDILAEYLNHNDIRAQIGNKVGKAFANIKIELPQKPRGIKKYNGVDWWYWLADPHSGSAASFCHSSSYGNAHHHTASTVGGCAPAFRVV